SRRPFLRVRRNGLLGCLGRLGCLDPGEPLAWHAARSQFGRDDNLPPRVENHWHARHLRATTLVARPVGITRIPLMIATTPPGGRSPLIFEPSPPSYAPLC